MERRFNYHNRDGVKRTLIHDDANRHQIRIHTQVEMDSVLASIEMEKNLPVTNPRSPNKLVARVPMTIYEQAHHEGWDEAKWKQWLNDPDNKAFRIWPGRV